MNEVRQRRRIVENPGGYETRHPPEYGKMIGTLLGRLVPTKNGTQAWAPSGNGFVLVGTFPDHNQASAKLEEYEQQMAKAKAAHAKARKQRGKKTT